METLWVLGNTLVLSLLFAGAVTAQVHVPGDYAELQAAIDAVAPDTVIIVHGGNQDPIVIHKPLTIMGDPAPFFEQSILDPDLPTETPLPAIRLVGPGHGTVRLIRIQTGGGVGFDIFGDVSTTIQGAGFDRLEILHCQIDAPDSMASDPLGGTTAIDVDIPDLLIADSVVSGGDSATQSSPIGVNTYSPFAGTGVIGNTVTVLDSTITGGKAGNLYQGTGCLASCAQVVQGTGGYGIIAQKIIRAASQISGGAGASVLCDFGSGYEVTCTIPPTADYFTLNAVVSLPNNLTASGPVPLGGTWDVSWFSLGNPALLLVSPRAASPVNLIPYGWLFIDIDAAVIFSVPGSGIVDNDFAIPNDSTVQGIVLHMQVYDPALGLTRPVSAALL